MKAEASGSFLNRAIYYRNKTKLFTVLSKPNQDCIFMWNNGSAYVCWNWGRNTY